MLSKLMSHCTDASQSKCRILLTILFHKSIMNFGSKFLSFNNGDVYEWHLTENVKSFNYPRLGDDPSRSTEVIVTLPKVFSPWTGPICPESPNLSRPYFRHLISKFIRARSSVNPIYWVYSFRKPSPDWLKWSTRSYYWPIRMREF